MLVLALALILTDGPDEEPWPVLRTRIESAPQAVTAFIERRAGCNHFYGEVGSGYAGREEQVRDALKKLRCDQLEADERALRKAKRNRPDLQKLLDDTQDVMPW